MKSTLVAVVKLSLPFENYDQYAWQSLAERINCTGNPDDTCLYVFASAIDLYEGNAAAKMGESETKEIQGVITQIEGKSVTIKSSSGSVFTITTPSDVIGSYNTNKAAQYYNNQMVKVGSTLGVLYVEALHQHSKKITPGMLLFVQFQTEIIGKSEMPIAY